MGARDVLYTLADFWDPILYTGLPFPALIQGEKLFLLQLHALLMPMGELYHGSRSGLGRQYRWEEGTGGEDGGQNVVRL